MESRVKNSIFLLLLLSVTISSATSTTTISTVKNDDDDKNKCVYTLYVRTGGVWKGGTDSIISVVLAGSDGWGVAITDLVRWGGMMGEDHDYYERGNLDIFSGRGPCLSSPPCWMNLTSDGSGPHHGWYCNYVEVTTTGPRVSCAQQLFTVEQWIATDAGPHELFAVRDYCSSPSSSDKRVVAAIGGGGRWLGMGGRPASLAHLVSA